MYVPGTVLDAVRVSGLKLGPHYGKVDGLTERLAKRGLLTVVVRITVVRKSGAHLNGSAALAVPVACEKVMVYRVCCPNSLWVGIWRNRK